MAKTIEITYEGEVYTLEYTRRIVKDMEDGGFSLAAMNNKPVTMFPILFAGAFRCHHRKLRKEKVEEIYNHLVGKEDLAEVLLEMYTEAIDTLFDEPEEGEKNAQWKSNF